MRKNKPVLMRWLREPQPPKILRFLRFSKGAIPLAAILAITALFSAMSCTKPKAGLADTVEIGEKMFVSQVNDVYLNADDYLGKTIKLEGIFKQDQGYEKLYCFVLRYGPGCCGTDGNVGFEVAWANEQAQSYPAIDSWVEATGVLKTYEEDGYDQYLYLDLSSLNVLSRRGAETVIQ